MSSPEPWAYLLRMPAGAGAIEVRNTPSVVARDGKEYFSLHRNRGSYEFKDICGGCSVDGKRVKATSIKHGSRISIESLRKEYIFVVSELSNEVLTPIGLNKTHAIAHLLGEGGFGAVYLCFEKKSMSTFALKIMKEGNYREKDILESLNHANLVNFDFFTFVGRMAFIGMEYLAGGDLSTFVHPTIVKLGISETKFIIYQIVEAIRYLHGKGICHRDLKPANILLVHPQPRTLIKVTDLGIAKSELLHSPMDTTIGTKKFMAPETHLGNYSKKVDVWSLGMILYLSLTGSFVSVDGQKVSFGNSDAVQKIKPVRNLLESMMKVSPSNRASIEDVAKNEWLQDGTLKKEVDKIKQEIQRSQKARTTPKPNPQTEAKRSPHFKASGHENQKQQENDYIGVAGAVGLVIGGIIVLAYALLFR